MIKIELKGMNFYAHHGVMPQETRVGNHFTVDLTLEVRAEASAQSDELTDTISYADVYELVREEMNSPSKLLEHVCGRIERAIHNRWPAEIHSIEVRVAKHNPPFGGDVQQAAVTLRTSY